jgi:hypothetical protein
MQKELAHQLIIGGDRSVLFCSTHTKLPLKVFVVVL